MKCFRSEDNKKSDKLYLLQDILNPLASMIKSQRHNTSLIIINEFKRKREKIVIII